MVTDRSTVLEKMRAQSMTLDQFNYERLSAPPLISFLNTNDINELHHISSSLRFSGKPMKKLEMIDEVMRTRNFRKLTGGTNRVIYKHLEYDPIIVKVAIDDVGRGDNPREYYNQMILKPFVTKVFDVSPCGTVGLFERVIPITSRQEFLSVASDAFDLISNWLTGEYVMDDIGVAYFLNFGIRKAFGLVLLDFPYLYKLDGNKLYCNKPDDKETSGVCGGVIDYDDGYNHLRCTKCGARYKAIDLQQAVENNEVILEQDERRVPHMRIKLQFGDGVSYTRDTDNNTGAARSIKPPRKGKKNVVGDLKVSLVKNGKKIARKNISEEMRSEENPDTGIRVRVVREDNDIIPEAESVNEEDIITGEDQPEVHVQTETSEAVKTEEAENDEETYNEHYSDGGFIEIHGKIDNTQNVSIVEEETPKKCIVMVGAEDNSMMLTDELGRPYCMTAIDGHNICDITILSKEAYTKLLDDLENVKRENEILRKEADKKEQEDVKKTSPNRDPKTGQFVSPNKNSEKKSSKSKKKNEEFDTSSTFIPESDTTELPVGSVPPEEG